MTIEQFGKLKKGDEVVVARLRYNDSPACLYEMRDDFRAAKNQRVKARRDHQEGWTLARFDVPNGGQLVFFYDELEHITMDEKILRRWRRE